MIPSQPNFGFFRPSLIHHREEGHTHTHTTAHQERPPRRQSSDPPRHNPHQRSERKCSRLNRSAVIGPPGLQYQITRPPISVFAGRSGAPFAALQARRAQKVTTRILPLGRIPAHRSPRLLQLSRDMVPERRKYRQVSNPYYVVYCAVICPVHSVDKPAGAHPMVVLLMPNRQNKHICPSVWSHTRTSETGEKAIAFIHIPAEFMRQGHSPRW